MIKKSNKLLALLLVVAMLAAVLCSCAKEESAAPAEPAETAQTESEAPAQEEAQPQEAPEASEPEAEPEAEAEEPTIEEEVMEAVANDGIVRTYTEAPQLPLSEDGLKLSAWDYVVPPVMSVISDYGTDGLVYKTLQERTGITLEFNTANLLTASNSMALMVAANELPDIIFNFGMFNSTPLDDLVEGDIIVNFCDYEEYMPNYFDIMKNNISIARDAYTDQGNLCLAHNIQDTNYVQGGGAIRNEWLVKDGLEAPVTLQDYEDILLAFQSENDCAHPFWLASNGVSGLISSAFDTTLGDGDGTIAGWDYKDGEFSFAPSNQNFKDYIEFMARWYEMGFIDPDFFSNTYSGSADNEYITGNRAGIWVTSVMGITNLSGVEDDCDVRAIPRAVMNEGDLIYEDDAGTSRISKGGAAIAGTNPEIEISCQLIDYFYSDEGILLANYGTEGYSFEYDENGDPQLTEMVTNPDDMAFAQALIKYTSSTPCSINVTSRNFVGYNEAQMEALTVWKATGTRERAEGSVWDTDDQVEYKNLFSDLSTYVSTYCLQFITGERSLDDWDEFTAGFSTFDIARMIELQQNALDNYLNKYVG